jgi:hypothetical protein
VVAFALVVAGSGGRGRALVMPCSTHRRIVSILAGSYLSGCLFSVAIVPVLLNIVAVLAAVRVMG